MNFAKKEIRKKKYVAPRVNKLGLEEAKVFLRDHTPDDDQHAKDILELLEETST